MIELFFAPTGNGRRAALALAEAGLPYRIHNVDFSAKPAALLAHNPGGKIPVLIDPDTPTGEPLVISQSGAIVLHISRRVGRFLPQDPAQRALTEQWFMLACSDMAGISATIFASGHDVPQPVAANTVFFEQRLFSFFQLCDQQLEGRHFLTTDALSIADIALYPIYWQRKSLIDQYGVLPHLTHWGERMHERPAVRKVMALDKQSSGVQS